MVDKEMIKKMQDLGIESDKILALLLDAPEEVQQPQAGNPKPEEKQPDPEPAKQETGNSDAVLAAIEKLTGTIAAANIHRMGGAGAPKETASDILAKVIMNKPKEEE